MRLRSLVAPTLALLGVTAALAAQSPLPARGPAFMRWAAWGDAKPALDSLYGADPAPLWLEECAPTPQARALVAWLGRADSLGLDVRDYDAAQLAPRLDRLARERCAAGDGVVRDTELALSAAAVRVVRALWLGRVDVRAAHANLTIPRQVVDRASFVRGLAHSGNVAGDLAALEPPFEPYQWLVQALHRYRALARDSTLVLGAPPAFPLRPGDPFAGAGRLRRKLVAVGDLPEGATGPDTLYDAALAEGVRAFQRRTGERADGVVGPRTWARLDEPLSARVRQIEYALERFRWLPREFRRKPILVNLPEFALYAFDSLARDTVVSDTMAVVVGKAYRSETPVFTGEMSYLVFSPYWEVPPGILRNEIGPAARRGGAAYLARNDYILASSSTGATLPSTAANIARIGRGVRVRQKPGPTNSLGGVKFMFPNQFNVYLHDTPAKALFGEADRARSHGCVRVADPPRLARWVLRDEPGDWTDERIRAAMGAGTERRVVLREKHPVFIVYATAAPRRGGTVRFLADVYGLDRELEALMAKPPAR